VVDNLLSADFPSVNAIADLNGTVYVVGQSGELSGDGIVRSNVGGSWQTVDNTGASVYQALTIDPVTGTPYARGITGLNMGASGWSVRSGPPVAPAAATTALATFSTTAIAGSSAQLSPQTGQIAPDSSASTDGSRLTDQLFDKPAKKAHAHGR